MNKNTFFKRAVYIFVLGLFVSNFKITIKANPIISISNVDELFGISDCLTCDYELINDIDLALETDSQYYDEQKGWPSIGTSSKPFMGSFNGNGHIIKNLTINVSTNRIGLFGNTRKASIKDLVLLNVDIKGNDYVGALVGYAYEGTTIENISVHGEVKGKTYVGGLVGNISNGQIQNIYTNGLISGQSSVGGILGRSTTSATATNLFSEALVVGEVCGDTYSFTCEVGGLVGSVLSTSGSISNGFFKGELHNGRESSYTKTTNKYVNPLVGLQGNNKLSNLYHHINQPLFNEFFISSENLNQDSSYEGFDFEQVWDLEDYAYLRSAYYLRQPQVIEIEISRMPHQLEFDEDELIDLSGLEVIALYDNEDIRVLDLDEYQINIDRVNQKVIVTYEAFETSFEIEIKPISYYSINLVTHGYGGKLILNTNDNEVDLTKIYRQETLISVDHDLSYFGRLGQLLLNDEPFDKTSFILNQDSNLEATYMLLGDHNDDGLLNEEDLYAYLALLKKASYQSNSDTNEDGQLDIADFVYLRRYILSKPLISRFKLNSESLSLKIDLEQATTNSFNFSFKTNQIGAIYLEFDQAIDDVKLMGSNNQIMINRKRNAIIIMPSNPNLQVSDEFKLQVQVSDLLNDTLNIKNIQYSDIDGKTIRVHEDSSFTLLPIEVDEDELPLPSEPEPDKQEPPIIESPKEEEPSQLPILGNHNYGTILIIMGFVFLFMSKKTKMIG